MVIDLGGLTIVKRLVGFFVFGNRSLIKKKKKNPFVKGAINGVVGKVHNGTSVIIVHR